MSYEPSNELNQLLYAGETVQVGVFDCPREHPRFTNSGPADGHLVVFPRHAVGIEHPSREPVIASRAVITLYNPQQEYRRRALSEHGDRSVWLRFDHESVLGALADCGRDHPGLERQAFHATHSHCALDTYLAQRRMTRALLRGEAEPVAVEDTAYALLRAAIRGIPGHPGQRSPRAEARHRRLALRCRELLATCYEEPLTLDDIARRLATTPFHLSRVFRRWTGGTLHQHLLDLRLRAAVDRLIEEPGRRITDLGLELGFSTPSHFTQRFRKGFGTTPRNFLAE